MHTIRNARWAVAGGLALLLASACQHDRGPRVTILRPDADAPVQLGSNLHLTVVFTAVGFSLRPVAGCGSDPACGIAHVNIDGDACNQPGKPYNSLLEAGTLGRNYFIDAEFEHCPPARRAGRHEVTISLYTSGGKPVRGAQAGATRAVVTRI